MRTVSLLLLVSLAACSKGKTTQKPPTPSDVVHPMERAVVSKQTGRLNLSQLRDSFPVVMGNDGQDRPITWNSGTVDKPKSGFDAYARTLGEADYIDRTEDDLDASPIYVKFMDDAARSACGQAIEADFDRADRAERTLLRHVELTDTPALNSDGFRRNLVYLKLRFHGIKVTDETQLDALAALFTAAGLKSKVPVEDGWRSVCVALLTAPEFHLY